MRAHSCSIFVSTHITLAVMLLPLLPWQATHLVLATSGIMEVPTAEQQPPQPQPDAAGSDSGGGGGAAADAAAAAETLSFDFTQPEQWTQYWSKMQVRAQPATACLNGLPCICVRASIGSAQGQCC